jgi:hypothetical protein
MTPKQKAEVMRLINGDAEHPRARAARDYLRIAKQCSREGDSQLAAAYRKLAKKAQAEADASK